MKNTVTISQGQAKFPAIVRQAEGGSVVTVTRHNNTVAYVIGRERLQAMAETLEILANPEAVQAVRDYRAGRTKFVPLSALK